MRKRTDDCAAVISDDAVGLSAISKFVKVYFHTSQLRSVLDFYPNLFCKICLLQYWLPQPLWHSCYHHVICTKNTVMQACCVVCTTKTIV